ncbi:hypothetical protein PM038_04405 [Halorubrum ezzemoulense]|jgi:hypothetical protein|uniref:hypothetical protein n=1 Tax=Halorubrum ezzemoulense TaxID=337243 RepID=UPI00232AD351|nr:hypothetical protein [Halorubrum ezzemoulense]MDB2284513.1 hypothetical protein [Halorubrum ezzemoulense]
MPGADRQRGILTTDDRDYLTGRKNLQPDSERNTRKRIRDRTRNGVYDFEYLTAELESRDVTQLVTDADEPNDELFDAAEDVIAFVFRMCAHAPDTGQSTDDRFRELLRNGIKKGLDERHEVLDFNLDLQYGLPREQRERLLRKVREGEDLTLPELREALENGYFDDSYRFRPLDNDGLPKNVDPKDVLSHDDL